MNIFQSFLSRFRWKFIGAVRGDCVRVNSEGAEEPGGRSVVYWLLHERGDGKRRFESIGTSFSSPVQIFREAQVNAWKSGGTLPPLEGDFIAPVRAKARLFSIPGGRGDAA